MEFKVADLTMGLSFKLLKVSDSILGRDLILSSSVSIVSTPSGGDEITLRDSITSPKVIKSIVISYSPLELNFHEKFLTLPKKAS